jgi:hypothetical protein
VVPCLVLARKVFNTYRDTDLAQQTRQQVNYKPVSNYTKRPIRKKPYQEQTLIMRVPLELNDADLDRNKMKRLS